MPNIQPFPKSKKRNPKINRHKTGQQAREKSMRREQAEQRQKEYDLLTPLEKLKRLDSRGFAAKKERAKLNTLLNKSRVEVPVPPRKKGKEDK